MVLSLNAKAIVFDAELEFLPTGSAVATQFFLAMTHHQLKDQGQAKAWLAADSDKTAVARA